METFQTEKQRYELRNLGPNAFAYAVKPSLQGGEPFHSLCINCYGEHVKSILQFARYAQSATVLVCPRCKSGVHVARDPDLPMRAGHRTDFTGF